MNCTFYNNDDLFEFRFIVYRFILLSNLRVIVSEFYDLDVGTVKKINIQPKRLSFAPSARPGWKLKEVTLYYFLEKLKRNLAHVLFYYYYYLVSLHTHIVLAIY